MLRKFLNPTRLRVWPWLFILVYLFVFFFWLFTATGIVDRSGSPLGTDFITFYAASLASREGQPAGLFNPGQLHRIESQIARSDIPLFAWHYPPTFLLAVYPLSYFPYLAALALWLAITIIPFLIILLKIFPHPATIGIFLAFPGTFQNILHGQNGFLTAALLGGGLLLLRSNPFIAGVLMGCLAYKPHLAILIIPALLASRQWNAIKGILFSASSLIAVTFLIWGAAPWAAFLKNINLARRILEVGAIPWFKMPTPFAAARLLGFSTASAQLLQVAATIAAILFVYYLWKTPRPFFQQASGLIVATLFASPFGFDYDLVILAPAIAFLCAGKRQNQNSGDALFHWAIALWALPFISPIMAKLTSIIIAPWVIALFCFFLYRNKLLINDLASDPSRDSSIAALPD